MEEEKTWLSELGEEEFLSRFEAVKGSAGLFKIDLEKLLPYQREIFVLDSEAMGSVKTDFFPVAQYRGFFCRGEIATKMQRTFMVIRKEDNSVIFQSGVDKGVSFKVTKDFLQGLIRHVMVEFAAIENESFPVHDFDDPAYVAVGLNGWGYEDTHVVVSPDLLDEFLEYLQKGSGISDLFNISKELNRGLPLLDCKKKRLGFITPARKDWFVNLPYITALDLFGELKECAQ